MGTEHLLDTLDKATGNSMDVFYKLYMDYFENKEDPGESLRIILEYPKVIGDKEDRHPQTIPRQSERRITLMFEEIISGTANRIAVMNLTKEAFYTKLYHTIFCSDSGLYPQSREEKAVALKILSEKVLDVPYYQITETCPISREEFTGLMNTLRPDMQEAVCMLRRQFPTVHERTAQILRISDRITDQKARIVFWGFVMSQLEHDRE